MLDKNLLELYKDLCGRMPYGVVCKMWFTDKPNTSIVETLHFGGLSRFYYQEISLKPYLRPMSSMLKSEKDALLGIIFGEDGKAFFSVTENGIDSNDEMLQDIKNFELHYVNFHNDTIVSYVDFCNSHYLDYKGLIGKGLALEATDGVLSEYLKTLQKNGNGNV